MINGNNRERPTTMIQVNGGKDKNSQQNLNMGEIDQRRRINGESDKE